MKSVECTSRRRPNSRIKAAIALFFLAPLFGEYLLGNLKFSEIALLPFIAPLYGGGALLIRETARRLGRGYGTMWGLGVAYALWEEGLVDMLFFNPEYFDGQAELTETYWPLIGADVWLVLILLAMHSIWSTLVPIILTERIFALDRTPWLGRIGLTLVGFVFLAGSAFVAREVYKETSFLATPAQWIGTAIVMLAVIAMSVKVGPCRPATTAWVHPGIAAVAALTASSLYMITDELDAWMRVVGCLLIVGAYIAFVVHWGLSPAWTHTHTLATIAGAILTYAWVGAFMEPETGPKSVIDHIGTAAIIAFVGMLWWKAWRLRNAPSMEDGSNHGAPSEDR